MTKIFEDKNIEVDINDLNNICDECHNEDESVSQNLILNGFKICKSCRVSKTIFPL
jgi:formate-dependent nitrite reductase cytochrome c552 subunit